MRSCEKLQHLLDFKCFEFIILNAFFHTIHVSSHIEIFSDTISKLRFFFIECEWYIEILFFSFCYDNPHWFSFEIPL
jgi:hypothetical protein